MGCKICGAPDKDCPINGHGMCGACLDGWAKSGMSENMYVMYRMTMKVKENLDVSALTGEQLWVELEKIRDEKVKEFQSNLEHMIIYRMGYNYGVIATLEMMGNARRSR